MLTDATCLRVGGLSNAVIQRDGGPCIELLVQVVSDASDSNAIIDDDVKVVCEVMHECDSGSMVFFSRSCCPLCLDSVSHSWLLKSADQPWNLVEEGELLPAFMVCAANTPLESNPICRQAPMVLAPCIGFSQATSQDRHALFKRLWQSPALHRTLDHLLLSYGLLMATAARHPLCQITKPHSEPLDKLKPLPPLLTLESCKQSIQQ